MLSKRKNNKAWFLVLPVVLVVAFTAIIPLMTVANYSVQDVLSPANRLYVGLDFFRAIATDPAIIAAFQRNLIFSTQILLIEIPLGIFIARLMPREGWKAAAALVIVAIPLIIPWNVVGITWRILARPDVGLLGVTVNQFRPFDIGNTPADAWVTMVAMDVWHWTPLVALLVYAGLRSIPQAYYQAAAIDAASPWSVFRFVELPKLRRVLMIALLLRFMDSFMIYAEPYILTGGGPGTSTEVMSILLSVLALIQFDLGKSAAFSLIYFLIIQVFSFIFFTVLTLDERPGATKKTKRTVIHKRDDAVDDVTSVEGGRS
ncbi:MAG: sugar ABC transporter permease [Pontimonas sp.]|jgi:glycerol transport system permease protein|nr:MAG: Binding-protein-dependent transport systems inner membrane component [actinobacterium acMicro-4]MCF8522326.1 sugar ABC transporter permease [Pontimonas sp.]MCF8547900.1 sugar ABC transporter permease [Pontimonas sp.]